MTAWPRRTDRTVGTARTATAARTGRTDIAPLLRAAVLPLRHSMLPAVLVAAVLLPVATFDWLDSERALVVLRWLGVLLTVGWLSAVDDPAGEVVAASPYPRALRTFARVLLAGVLVVPAWAWAALLVHLRQPFFPILSVSLEALALAVAGIAVATGLRAWRDVHLPAQLASLGVLAFFALAAGLPRRYALQVDQTWGPPWTATHLRWIAVLLLGLAVVAVALRDPLAARAARRR